MKTKEFIERFGVESRALTGVCDGVTVHAVHAGDRWFGGVIDGDEAWVVPMHSRFAATHFMWSVCAQMYDAVEGWMMDVHAAESAA